MTARAPIGRHLLWDDASAVVAAIEEGRQRFLSRMLCQLGSMFETLAGRPGLKDQALSLRDRFSSLTEEGLLRLLLSPETHRALTAPLGDGGAVLRFLDLALVAEECALGRRTAPTGGVWTANGALRFDARDSAASERIGHGPAYTAPLLADRIILDIGSPYAGLIGVGANLALDTSQAERLEADQVKDAVGKVRLAMEGLVQASAPAGAMVTGALQVVVLNKHPTRENVFRSISSRVVIGKALIVNPHIAQATLPRIADALLHESIHSFLYEKEQAGRWVLERRAEEKNIRSPWTGSMLSLDSYLHACFVWFALTHFWRLPTIEKAFQGTDVEPLRERAARGFKAGGILAPVERHLNRINPTVPDEIQWLCNNVA